MLIQERLKQYIKLTRLDKPIGILLLLWPTLWALWLAGQGKPHTKIVIIFICGVILMRSAGCVINDFADRFFDGFVARTANRPIVAGRVHPYEALFIALVLALLAFVLVLFCNVLTISLSFIAVILAILYPFLKRITHLPQVGLGFAFSFGVPMAFAAQTGELSIKAGILYLTAVIWPVIYDTMYAMVDREDDLRIGVKSTAILFNQHDRLLIAILQVVFVMMLAIVGMMFRLHYFYYLSLGMTLILFAYQQFLIKEREPSHCFQAFLNNHWVGLVIFMGIVLGFFGK